MFDYRRSEVVKSCIFATLILIFLPTAARAETGGGPDPFFSLFVFSGKAKGVCDPRDNNFDGFGPAMKIAKFKACDNICEERLSRIPDLECSHIFAVEANPADKNGKVSTGTPKDNGWRLSKVQGRFTANRDGYWLCHCVCITPLY